MAHRQSESVAPTALLHTPEDAAALASVSRTTIYELMASGRLASVKIGRSRRVPHAALVDFVDLLVAEQHAA